MQKSSEIGDPGTKSNGCQRSNLCLAALDLKNFENHCVKGLKKGKHCKYQTTYHDALSFLM